MSFEQRDGYVFAVVKADAIDAVAALEYLTEVAGECTQLGCERLMLYRDIPAMLPDGDLFFVTKRFLSMIGGTKVAFVNPHAKISTDMHFAMTIGNNRGANYSLFGCAETAEEWLLTP